MAKSKELRGLEQKWRDEEALRKRYMEEGKYIRVSALWHPSRGLVKVIFRGKSGDQKAYWMTREAYRHRFDDVTTVEDYPTAVPAKTTDIFDAENGTYALTYGPEVPMDQVPKGARRQTILARLTR